MDLGRRLDEGRNATTRRKEATKAWKVGELAERTGLSVRALHHYEDIGLLRPPERTEAGHRFYTEEDVMRLQQIASLRSLGFSLSEIRECLTSPSFSPSRVVELHVARLKERIELEERLCERLEAVAARLAATEGSAGEGSKEIPVEQFIEMVMEVTRMSERIEKYYSPEQREQLERRRRELGEQRIREVEGEWPALMEQVRAEIEAGTDPADERVQALARRWMELVEEMTGGDPGIRRSLGNVWEQEEENLMGIDPAHMREMIGYISEANAASEGRG